jgi:hypothetical protein
MTKADIVGKTAGVVLFLFGAVTLFLTLSIFFDLFGIREKEGNYVLFVVSANFISSLFYLPAAYGFWNRKAWTTYFLSTPIIVLIVGFLGLLYHIDSGGLYEEKTINAMIFRIVLTLVLAVISFKVCPSNKKTA